MSTTPFIACFRLSEYANVRYRIEAASHADARSEASRLAALTGLDLLSVEPDEAPELDFPMVVPAEPVAGSRAGI